MILSNGSRWLLVALISAVLLLTYQLGYMFVDGAAQFMTGAFNVGFAHHLLGSYAFEAIARACASIALIWHLLLSITRSREIKNLIQDRGAQLALLFSALMLTSFQARAYWIVNKVNQDMVRFNITDLAPSINSNVMAVLCLGVIFVLFYMREQKVKAFVITGLATILSVAAYWWAVFYTSAANNTAV